MTDHPRIALIHATRIAVDPIEAAAESLWPEAETITMLEESLSVDRAKEVELSDELSRRITAMADYATSTGADGILFTCSAFGRAIDVAADKLAIPVMKPNEAMFDAAFSLGTRVAMIYTFEPAAAGMEAEFHEAAVERNSGATIQSLFCAGAIDAKRAGDDETHDRLIAETASNITDADVILLAQFSMASAAPLAQTKTDIPILTSPEASIMEIRRRVEQSRKG